MRSSEGQAPGPRCKGPLLEGVGGQWAVALTFPVTLPCAGMCSRSI